MQQATKIPPGSLIAGDRSQAGDGPIKKAALDHDPICSPWLSAKSARLAVAGEVVDLLLGISVEWTYLIVALGGLALVGVVGEARARWPEDPSRQPH